MISRDGTRIVFDRYGRGPAVILIAGAMGTRLFGLASLARLLATGFTAYSYDRRGRGDSGDTAPYAVEREIEDLEALIDAAGGSACLFGISSGACLALEAAAGLDGRVEKLALYEAPYNSAPEDVEGWKRYRTDLDRLLSAGDRGGAVARFMRFVGVPEEMVAGMRRAPMWPGLEAVAHTLPYDAAVIGEDRSVPVERAGRIDAPTLVLDGGASLPVMPFMRDSAVKLAEAIPDARHRTLEGQGHDVDMNVLAPVLVSFFSNGGKG